MQVPRRGGQLSVTLMLLALGLYGIVAASAMPMGSVALPGPGVFPLALSILLSLATLWVLAGMVLRAPPQDEPVELFHGPVLLGFVALCGVALLLERIGFLLTMTSFLFVLYKAFSSLGWLRAAAAAIISALALYAFFGYAIGVALPRGDLS